MTSSNTPKLRHNDVISYTADGTKHCREELALVSLVYSGKVVAKDTYWHMMTSESHRLTESELLTAVVIFNRDDYTMLDRSDRDRRTTWEKYRPVDRKEITAQHGLMADYYLKKGAVADLEVQLENQRRLIATTTATLTSIQHELREQEYDLIALLDQQAIQRIAETTTATLSSIAHELHDQPAAQHNADTTTTPNHP